MQLRFSSRAQFPLVYGEIGGLEKIAFRRNASGAVAELLPFPAIYEGQRVPWHRGKVFIGLVIGGSLLLALLTVVLWAVAVIIRKRYKRPLFATKRDRLLYFFSRIAGAWSLVSGSCNSSSNGEVAFGLFAGQYHFLDASLKF